LRRSTEKGKNDFKVQSKIGFGKKGEEIMKFKNIVVIGFFALIAFVSISQVTRAGGDIAVGAKFEGFSLVDADGKSHSYTDLKGKNGTVLVFLSVQCPVVKGYDARINEIASAYESKGISFIGINSNSTETPEAIKEHAAANYKFPVLIDKNNVLADKMGATVTPEIYYFNAKDVLMYEGAIDNDRSGKNVSITYAKTAFDSGLSGKAIETTSAKAFGCSIKRAKSE
jgi:peroxiredoxin